MTTLTITPAPITVTADINDTFVYTLDADGSPVTWAVNTTALTAAVSAARITPSGAARRACLPRSPPPALRRMRAGPSACDW